VPPYAAPSAPPPGYAQPPAPQGYGSPQGYAAPQGYSAPQGYAAPAPQGYGPPASQGYAAPQGYGPGYGTPYGAPAYPQRKTDGLAVASLVCGIGGILFSWTIVLGLACIAAVILGHLSLKRLKTSNDAGYGMAMAGTIIGWVGTGIIALIVIFAVILPLLFFIGFMGAVPTYSS
jgi:hypothetical protein